MKAQILKIAGVKSEKEFYKKYPSEAAFMKQHGKAFKKAQTSSAINKAQVGTAVPFEQSLQGVDNPEWYEDAMSTATNTATLAPMSNSGAFDINKFGISPQTLGKTTAPTTTQAPGWTGSMFKTPGIPTQEYANQKQISGEGEIQRAYDSRAQEANVKPQMNPAEGIPLLGSIFGGIAKINAAKEANRYKKQTGKVLDLQNLAMNQRPNVEEHYYDSPEQNVTDANTLSPIRGVGSNVLAAKNGRSIGGNPTEIQNTYGNGNSLYDDLGYAPLGESDMSDEDIVKQYRSGGFIPKAFEGFDFTSAGEGVASGGGSSGGGQIGAGIGGFAGKAFGDKSGIGSIIGAGIGAGLDMTSSIGRDYDRANDQKMAAIQNSIMSNSAGGIYKANRKNGGDIYSYEEGGYMNPEYNPQVITMFGDHNAQDFADYAHKFRAGGHLKSYTPPSERAMETYRNGGGIKSYGLGGELETHWGGGAETMSHNPYLPGTGETVMFRGKSHEEYSPNGETGIGVTYGGNPVEVERGEPMVELEEGGTVDPETGEVQKSGVVFGNLKIPNQYLDLLGDKSAKGKKFKNYVGVDLYKQEKKGTKLVEEGTALANKQDVTPLELNVAKAKIFGGNSILKTAADRKINAAHLQNAINDTAEEHGIVADDLARGKVKIDKEAMQTREARWGDAISKAAGGKTVTTETTKKPTWEEAIARGFTPDPKTGKLRKLKKAAVDPTEKTVVTPGKGGTEGTGGRAAIAPIKDKYRGAKMSNEDWKAFLKTKQGEAYKQKYITGTPELKAVGATAANPDTTEVIKTPGAPAEYEEIETEEPGGKFPWEGYANQLINYLRPSDQEALDMEQLYPEMYAMSSNQLEPVPAQGYQPDLGVPYDISLQDQLNANQADYRATQRMVGYNPAAQAQLNAQKYQANQGVLGEQFRANQAMKDKVYGENRNILNDAKLKNLAIYDQQYGRQAEALSNTKATTQAALNSISDKYAKNKLENRTLGVYENMYNYRFGKDSKADNWNPLQFFDTEAGGAKSQGNQDIAGLEATRWDKNGTPIAWKKATDKSDNSSDDAMEAVGGIKNKNGGSVKKNQKNSSVVRAYKNL